MSVRLRRTVAALGVALAMALGLGACSGSTSGAHGATSPETSSPAGVSSSPTQSSSRTPGAPITAVALPDTGTSTPSSSSSSGNSAGSTAGSSAAESTETSAASSAPPMPPATSVTGQPALNSTGVAPAERISIKASGGTIVWLEFTNPDGKKVKGSLAKDHRSWTLGERLGFGKTYTVTGIAVNSAGVQTKISGTYRTATTVEPITTTISPGDGAVVGVAAPVIVRFGMNPQDKALVEKNVKITTIPKVEGGWAWITHDGDSYPSLDWRPKKYWPAGTKVHVESDIYGVKFADGWYGGEGQSVDFTIGRNQVVVANATTHRMTVTRNGSTIWTFDASLGMGDDPNGRYGLNRDLVTRSGIHVVMDKSAVYKMSNPKYHYEDVTEYWAVRISNNGEFIHNNPGTSAWNLANANVTHGCVNLSWDNAKKYYESVLYGDPVEVVGTSVKLGPADGDIYDWAIPWSTWQTLSALSEDSVWA